MRIRVVSAHLLGAAAADEVAGALRRAIGARGAATLAVSGGKTPAPMFSALAAFDLPWDVVDVFQVDERIAPAGDPARNATAQAVLPGRFHPMPVEDPDPAAAAARYAASLPDAFDCIHLGLGDDGHTASLLPGDPVLDEEKLTVAVTGVYQGRARMTLTRPVLDRARQVVWLVSGASKRARVAQLMQGDPSIPAGRIRAPGVLVLDPSADPAS